LVRRSAVRALRALTPTAQAALTSSRRQAFIARTRLAAAVVNATVDLTIAPDVVIGRDVRVTVEPHTRNVLQIGPKSRLDDRVLVQLKGGTIRIGDEVKVRRDCVLNVAGELIIEGDSPISWGTVIHCSSRIHLERMVGMGEYVTLVDSSHYFTEPDAHWWHNVRTGSIEIGRDTWLCPKVTVTRDAKIGSHCIVGAGSVVVGEVPAGSLASGVPATFRPLPLPW
jgi:acetyltransferase-like isoleucine patch superfamily enzyme